MRRKTVDKKQDPGKPESAEDKIKAKIAEAEKRFDEINAAIRKLDEQKVNMLQEQFRLQGEYRALTALCAAEPEKKGD